jgi:Eukaryotic rRNA processing protein EBP2
MPEALSDDSEDEIVQQKRVQEVSESDQSYDEKDSDMEIAARDNQESEEEGDLDTAAKEKFGLRGIYERERIITRLNEIRANFYNRLSSQKLINNTKGRIPFSEHMTITNDKALEVPEALTVHDDIKREIAFYNMTRENVKKGMEILV